MPAYETPKANPENLLSICKGAYEGKVVVPEFQRSFIWSRNDIEELMVSVIQGYFIGTFLMLDTPADQPMFPFRVVEGLDKVNPAGSPHQHATVRLVLDGQQRITSLFYVLYEPDIPLRWTMYPYRFFLRLDLALQGDVDEAVVGISIKDRRRMSEMQRLVQAHQAVPFSLLRDSGRFYKWLYNEQDAWHGEALRQLDEDLYQRFEKFMVPVVALSPETGKANIVNIFERINRTGVSLSLFDLAVARLYLKGVRLRDLWEDFENQHEPVANVVKPEFLLKVIALLQGKEPRKRNLLDVIDALDADAFLTNWEAAVEFVVKAYERITKHFGAFDEKWIPYTTMIVPLAALLCRLASNRAGEVEYRKVDRWYWASVFTQRYDSAVDTTTYRDVKEVVRWLGEGIAPEWLDNLSVDNLDLDVDEPRSAVYRGLMCLVALQGARDFLTGQPAPLHECQDDHIFARAAFGKHYGVNSIFNRTLISTKTNQQKRDKKPSEFLELCLRRHGNDNARLNKTLQSHFISTDGRDAMGRDDLDAFLTARGKAFAAEVERRLKQA